MNRDQLEHLFPNLRSTAYEITSPRSTRYNCAAYVAGDADRWWWPEAHPNSYWPGSRRDESLDAIVEVFGNLGYEVCDSPTLESGFEKIAIYVDDLGPQHLARQLPSGMWSSKCGRLEDITHTLEGLDGEEYGKAHFIMKRRCSAGLS